MSNQELCLLLETILELIRSGNADRAAKAIENGIKRIDKTCLNYEETEQKQENT